MSPNEKHPTGFWVLTNTRSLELMAESAEDAARWVSVIQETANMVPPSLRVANGGDSGEASPTLPPPPPPPKRESSAFACRARALYDYVAEQDDELSLTKGEVIEVVTMEGEWWLGFVGDTHGTFPSNYVEVMGEIRRPAVSGAL